MVFIGQLVQKTGPDNLLKLECGPGVASKAPGGAGREPDGYDTGYAQSPDYGGGAAVVTPGVRPLCLLVHRHINLLARTSKPNPGFVRTILCRETKDITWNKHKSAVRPLNKRLAPLRKRIGVKPNDAGLP